jgi:PleD family two-component response regulator
VITVQPDGELEPADLVQRVDNALYEAKDSGRNTIAVAQQPVEKASAGTIRR